jgi:excisionase family DNA binding protein
MLMSLGSLVRFFCFGELERTMSLVSTSELRPISYSVADFCRVTGLGRSTVYNLINKGEIEVSQIGHRKLISHKAAEALLERSIVKPDAA